MSKPSAILDERFTVNQFQCGCLIRSEFQNGGGQKWIAYCDKHLATPLLYEALGSIPEGTMLPLPVARKISEALKAARGEQ